MEVSCRACGAALDNGDVIEATVDDALGAEAYIRAKDAGEDGPIFDCPECQRTCFIDLENRCANCGYFPHASEGCAICGEAFPLAELLSNPEMMLCSYHQWQMDKDD